MKKQQFGQGQTFLVLDLSLLRLTRVANNLRPVFSGDTSLSRSCNRKSLDDGLRRKLAHWFTECPNSRAEKPGIEGKLETLRSSQRV